LYRFFVRELPDGFRVCEVGVAQGSSTIFLNRIAKESGKHFEQHAADCFPGDYKTDEAKFLANLHRFGADDVIFHRGDSVEVAEYLAGIGIKFHMVFLDGDHSYDYVMREIPAWWSLLTENGWLAGHDYESCPGVRQAVEEQFTFKTGATQPLGFDAMSRTSFWGDVWVVRKIPKKAKNYLLLQQMKMLMDLAEHAYRGGKRIG
jgi:hypothetical protein